MAQDVPFQWAKIAAWEEAKFGWKVKSKPSYHAVLPVALHLGPSLQVLALWSLYHIQHSGTPTQAVPKYEKMLKIDPG